MTGLTRSAVTGGGSGPVLRLETTPAVIVPGVEVGWSTRDGDGLSV